MCFSIIAALMASSDVCLSVGGRALDAWIRPQRTILGMARPPFLLRISLLGGTMYRDAPLPGAPCYKHASAPMAAQCERCERALCDPCIVYFLSSPHCIDCARAGRRRRSLVASAKIGGVLAAIAGAVLFVATRRHPFDYGAET